MIVLENGAFRKTTSGAEVLIYNCLQELQLFLGENPYRAELGIDYIGVFNGEVFLRDKIQSILNNHSDNFSALEMTNYELSSDGETLDITIKFSLSDKEVLQTISVGAS